MQEYAEFEKRMAAAAAAIVRDVMKSKNTPAIDENKPKRPVDACTGLGNNVCRKITKDHPDLIPLDEVEISPNSLATCKNCQEKICKGDTRIKKSYKHEYFGWRTKYYHKKCLTDLDRMSLNLDRSCAPTTLEAVEEKLAEHLLQKQQKATARSILVFQTRGDLREMLRDLRIKFAGEENKELFMIFNNKAIDDIVEKMPSTTGELLRCNGIGPAKSSQYGTSILQTIHLYKNGGQDAECKHIAAKRQRSSAESFILAINAIGGVEKSPERNVNVPLNLPQILDKKNNILVDETLVAEAEIQQSSPEKQKEFTNPPDLTVAENRLKLLDSGDDSDVSFKVGNETLYAHQFILESNARHLSNICLHEGYRDNPVPIDGATPEIFLVILEYIYGQKTPEGDFTFQKGKEIINAANRYRVSGLTSIVESTLVSRCAIGVSNVADCILFAEANSCPLLKQHAIAYFVAQSNDSLRSDSLDELLESGSLMREIMSAMSDKNGSSGKYAADTDAAESMSAYQQLMKLYEKRKDIKHKHYLAKRYHWRI